MLTRILQEMIIDAQIELNLKKVSKHNQFSNDALHVCPRGSTELKFRELATI